MKVEGSIGSIFTNKNNVIYDIMTLFYRMIFSIDNFNFNCTLSFQKLFFIELKNLFVLLNIINSRVDILRYSKFFFKLCIYLFIEFYSSLVYFPIVFS